jgi:hypothetical protein
MPAARWTEKDVAKTNAGKLTKAKTKVVKAKPDKSRRVMMGGVAVDNKSKYFNKRCKVDGIWFDSKVEAAYYERLKLEKAARKVSFFVLQPRFLLPGGITYVADFLVVRDDPLVMGSVVQVVDTKGFETDVFKLKRKLMADMGIEIIPG